MKNLLFLLFSLSALIAPAQPFNQEIARDDTSVLLGKINKDILLNGTYKEWFETHYNEYQPNKEQLSIIKNKLPEYTITAFFGTWCGDSREELPRFYKVLDEANFPLARLTTVAVNNERDHYKQSPGGEEEGHTIHRVPTFIFYKDGKEVNRIVEHPVSSFEADVVEILQQENYIPNYQAVTTVSNTLAEMGLQKFQKKSKKLLPKLKKEAKSLSELNTYSSVLFYSEQKDEAIAVAKLNTLLYPEEAYTYENLGNKLYLTHKLPEALEYYKKSFALNPKNERVQKAIAKIEETQQEAKKY
ncbi:thioredoxin family protein [Ulvibacter litoralis]|uniref:Thiol-disulfide isomerase or thioredoxin n=1 Tax=Ulvibacter litoralis TaxID=227084 RepID=A0A1G7C5R9_9FLAO|nr:thioredoxin family protein [Ulvibacter litoralis]GHC48732.1 hypothetical protein GCM10008083_10140 [Ulvibacter litoralis]SDE34120.1 Thiol-disulfide isomerase or thioredoxin [Ulvibacter litoralis]